MMIDEWAARWGIAPHVLDDLKKSMGMTGTDPATCGAGSEAAVQNLVRLEATRLGGRLWRNNVGVAMDERGVPIRYGLCNDSQKLNKLVKSSDLIGVMPRLVTPDMVGRVVGIFTAREIKTPGWVYRGSDRERAQLKFLEIVAGLGGNAGFATGTGGL